MRAGVVAIGLVSIAHGFTIRPVVRPLTRMASNFDYEYIPPRLESLVYPSDLPSAYPPSTPAGLRGEAVRSALRSPQCIGWCLQDTPLAMGVVKIAGDGCRDFLNNKLTQRFAETGLTRAGLLDARGRLIDSLVVAQPRPKTAYLFTSPGHASTALFERLNPFVFPLDQITLEDHADAFIFTLASLQYRHLQATFTRYMAKYLGSDHAAYRLSQDCALMETDTVRLLITADAQLPGTAAVGYTFCFLDGQEIGQQMWQHLIADSTQQGPVEIGAAEYESLRIEAGHPGFGREMTAGDKSAEAPASPLELHLDAEVDLEKGCYQGQEGIASLHKNPRGPPRLLYQVVFDDEVNIYEHESRGDDGRVENLTTLPQPGDKLYVLGSNEEIAVGTLTSLAEPGSTGDPVTLGLALIRRADSILKQMASSDLEIPRAGSGPVLVDVNDRSTAQPAPKLAPLDGLEVIVGGTHTVGTLRTIPSKRLRPGALLFQDIPDFVTDLDDDSMPIDMSDSSNDSEADWVPTSVVDEDKEEEEDLAAALAAAAKAQAEAEAAAAEAKRKTEKMELLRKRAEEAMARRKKKGASG